MKEFKKTKPLLCLLKELPIGETIVVDNKHVKTTSVRQIVTNLRKLGYEFKASSKGYRSKIAVTKLSNNNHESI